MKLATYKDGSRDGQLVVVSRDLSTAHFATGIATRLQQALDDWNFIAPLLQDLSVALNHGKTRHAFPFEAQQCMAPLPRACHWAAGGAYLDHVERLHQLEGWPLAEGWRGEPAMYAGAGDDFLGPTDAAAVADAAWGIDFEAGLAVVTGDVALGAAPGVALEGVRLVMLANGWILRELARAERARGGSVLQSRPAPAFGPVALTPDELGQAWQGGRVHLPVQSSRNGRKVGSCEAGPGMSFHFGQLIAHLARTRNVRAGTVVGSGTVANQDTAQGCSCIADRRALEMSAEGEPRTGFLQYGDVVKIEMKREGVSLFGAIEQQVVECD